jgi:general secretion pathway protein D
MQDVRSADARAAAVVLVALLAAGCATSTAFRNGQQAERNDNYDQAVVEYTRALRENPDDAGARAALDRARVRASQEHFFRGRRLAASERYEEALAELQLATELNPSNADADALLRDTRQKLRARIAVSRGGKTELEALVERSREFPAPGLDLPQGRKLPDSLVFSQAGSRAVFTAIARFADLNVVFDPAFREETMSVDLRNTSLEEALAAVTASTRTFYRVTAQKTLTIVPDTPPKRREYEESVVRTFYLSNADVKEVIDLLRIVVDVRQISPITATNAVSLKDTPERIAAAARLISAIDKARPEVVIDVELLEVDRTRLKEWGLQIASPGDPPIGISGSADVNREGLTLQDLRNLTPSDVFMYGVPGIYYRLLKSDVNTRTLANPQLRTAEGITAQARFGERIPVPNATFVPIAGGGVNTQPITSYAYEDIGVNIDITPRTHHEDEVSLTLKVVLSAVSGTGFGGLPTIANREISTTIRLKDGETNMLAGLIRDEERTVLNGIPGLSDLPLIGKLFAANRKESRQTDIILTLTPHIVRVLDLSEADLQPFRVGRDAGAPAAQLPQVVPRDRIDLPPDMQPPAEQPAVKPLNPFFPYELPSTKPGLPFVPGTPVPVTPPKKPGGGG